VYRSVQSSQPTALQSAQSGSRCSADTQSPCPPDDLPSLTHTIDTPSHTTHTPSHTSQTPHTHPVTMSTTWSSFIHTPDQHLISNRLKEPLNRLTVQVSTAVLVGCRTRKTSPQVLIFDVLQL